MAFKTAILINFITPYHLPFFESLNKKLPNLKVLVSTGMEPNRKWEPYKGSLNIIRQKTISLHCYWHHPHGFTDRLFIHIPIDTIPSLIRYHPEIVISTEMGFRSLQALLFCKLSKKTKLCIWAPVSEHTEKGRGKLRFLIRKILLSQADAVFVNGNSGRRYIKQFGVPDKKITFLPYTVDNSTFSQIPLTRSHIENKRMLYVGQLIDRKGILQFISVLKTWAVSYPSTNIDFWIAGEGPALKSIESMSLPSNLSLTFLGNIPYHKLPEIYAQCGIFVFPTLADEWGVVVNEAMASGLPVFGSLYSQAVEEMVIEGKTGWTYFPDKKNMVFSSLGKLFLSSDEDISIMRQNARNKILEYDPSHVATRITNAIKSL